MNSQSPDTAAILASVGTAWLVVASTGIPAREARFLAVFVRFFVAAVALQKRAGMQPLWLLLFALVALTTLAGCGKGADADSVKPPVSSPSVEALQAGVEKGEVAALHTLASRYLDGQGVEKDQKKAQRLFLQAAERDYPFSQTALGLIHWFGWGVEKNPVEAYAWWLVAEDRDPLAGENLAKVKGRMAESAVSQAQARAAEIRQMLKNSKDAAGLKATGKSVKQ